MQVYFLDEWQRGRMVKGWEWVESNTLPSRLNRSGAVSCSPPEGMGACRIFAGVQSYGTIRSSNIFLLHVDNRPSWRLLCWILVLWASSMLDLSIVLSTLAVYNHQMINVDQIECAVLVTLVQSWRPSHGYGIGMTSAWRSISSFVYTRHLFCLCCYTPQIHGPY